MKFMALDFGLKRIGMAISDPEGRFALPHRTLERLPNNNRGDIAALLQTIKDHDIQAVICGVPSGSQKSESTADIAGRFFAKLRETVEEAGLRLEWHQVDERFSTALVLNELKSAGITHRSARESGAIDAGAAAVMLQTFLDARKSVASNGEESLD